MAASPRSMPIRARVDGGEDAVVASSQPSREAGDEEACQRLSESAASGADGRRPASGARRVDGSRAASRMVEPRDHGLSVTDAEHRATADEESAYSQVKRGANVVAPLSRSPHLAGKGCGDGCTDAPDTHARVLHRDVRRSRVLPASATEVAEAPGRAAPRAARLRPCAAEVAGSHSPLTAASSWSSTLPPGCRSAMRKQTPRATAMP